MPCCHLAGILARVTDLGDPTSYLEFEEGVAVFSADGEEIGAVEHVLADADADIFDGLVIDTRLGPGGHRFADATQVDAPLHARRGAHARRRGRERLPEPSENPAVLEADPDDTAPTTSATSSSAPGTGSPATTSAVRVLLTNDDGIEAEGLQALRRALLAVEGIELAVIAPDSNRSAIGRGITTRRPLWVRRSTSATAPSATRPTARPSTACASPRSGSSRASRPS